MRRLVSALVLLAFLAAGCGEEGTEVGTPDEVSTGGNFEEGTLALTTRPRRGEGGPEGTLREGTRDGSDAVLRLEGDPKTTFSGICAVGDKEQVLTGRVPKRFDFDLDGRALECRIQKQDERRGSLNVVFVVDDNTRSAQQTDRPGGTIELSYDGRAGD